MRKAVLLSIVLIIFTIFTGCKSIQSSRREISDIEFVRAIAIDTSPLNTGYVRLTISSERVNAGVGGKSEEKEALTIYSEGRTVFEAISNFNKYLGKNPFFGHLEYIVIGEDAARDGIYKYLDFFSRDHEIRLNLKVFVLKGDRAETLMEKGSSKGKFVFDRLEGLVENRDAQSVTNVVNLIEVMYIMDLNYLSLYLPCIEMVEAKSKDSSDNSNDIKMAGFAIFDKDKLVAHLGDDMGRGLNWLRNKIQSGIIVVESSKECKVSLEIIDAKTKIQPKIENGELSATVNIEMSSNIGEIQSTENIFNSETFSNMERQQEQVIKREVENVIKISQEEIGLDFYSIGHEFYHKYPIAWEDIYVKNWRTVFPRIKFNVVVKSKINRTYYIKQPSAVEAGDGK